MMRRSPHYISSFLPALIPHLFLTQAHVHTPQPSFIPNILRPFCSHRRIESPEQNQKLISLLKQEGTLQSLGFEPTPELVRSAIEQLREDWKTAVSAFEWGQKHGLIDQKVFNLMVDLLGSHQKFSIAWCLIRDLHRMKMDMRQPMLIMIDRYAAANSPSKAIWAFQLVDKFQIVPDEEAFHALLHTLCKHGNIEEAEEFMLLKQNLFPLQAESFNIILHGWCDIITDVAEAKRVWREMSKHCVLPNATSYAHMISCFSKVGNLFDSLRMFDEMSKRGWTPGLDAYNSLIYALTREGCLPQAFKLLKKIKESGLKPNQTTYHSMIHPLCIANKLKEARGLLSLMLEEGIEPTIHTYHAFLEGTGLEGTFEVFSFMKKADVGPTRDTFLLILNRFFKLNQAESALKVWVEMREYEMEPDQEHYRAVVCGLAASGYLTKANELYSEMISKGFPDEPKLKKLLKKPPSRWSRPKRGWNVNDDERENRISLRKGTMVKFKNHRQRSNERRRKMKSNRISTLNESCKR